MKSTLVFYTIGNLLICLSATLLFPLGIAAIYKDGDLKAFALSFAITLAIGVIFRFSLKPFLQNGNTRELGNKEGFAVVSLSWIVTALAGTLPFLFFGSFAEGDRGFISEFAFCFFESMSGLTTTGSTVLTEIEGQPHGILFWRSLTHWLGGMGIVVLGIAILPLLGIGGMQLFKAEAPGPQSDRMTPRIAQTAKLLWGIYVLITMVEVVLLWIGTVWIVPIEFREAPGEALFNAFCHAFGTMATGGFATKNASIGHYNSVYIDVVIMIFMFLAGTNFTLHFYALRRGDFRSYFRDEEFRFYLIVLVTVISFLAWNTMGQKRIVEGPKTVSVGEGEPVYDSIGDSLRFVGFQSLAIVTTTGYGTADFEKWPFVSQFILVCLMFFGGCAGSTGGGMKQVRFLLLIKQGYLEIKRLILPHAVLPVKLSRKVVPPEIMKNILGFFFISISILTVTTITLTALGVDLVTAITAVISAMNNIGPGLGEVGPVDNYSNIPTAGKYLLTFCMMLGRLELYTVLVLFSPAIWKK